MQLQRIKEGLHGLVELVGEVVQLSEHIILEKDIYVEISFILLHDEIKHLDELVQIFIIEVGSQQVPKQVQP